MLRRRITIAAVVMIAVGFMTTTQAYSAEKQTTTSGTENYIPCETAPSISGNVVEMYKKGTPSQIVPITTMQIDPKYMGNEARVLFNATNNGSVHPNSAIIVSSGSDTASITDIESTANKVSQSDDTLKLTTSTVTVSVRLGSDGYFSAKGNVTLDIVCKEKPTTTVPPTTVKPTTTIAPTTVPPTTIVEFNCPEGKTMIKDEKRCEEPVTPTTVKITCPEGTTMSADMKTCEAPPVTVVEKPVEVQEVQLAKTGSDTTLMSLFGTLLVLAGAVMLMGSRLAIRNT